MRLDQEGKRRRVVDLGGVEGYITRWSQDCSGCTERGEMGGTKRGPFGCHECGYTGRRRRHAFVPFDTDIPINDDRVFFAWADSVLRPSEVRNGK